MSDLQPPPSQLPGKGPGVVGAAPRHRGRLGHHPAADV